PANWRRPTIEGPGEKRTQSYACAVAGARTHSLLTPFAKLPPVPQSIHDALAHHQQGRLHEAESIYLPLLLKQPDDVDALHYLGVLRMRQGRLDEAIDFVKRALKLAPHNADAWNNLGNMLLAGNNEKAAEFAYTYATNQKPDYAEAWYNLANLLRRQRRRNEAVKCYRRVIELNRRFAGAYE